MGDGAEPVGKRAVVKGSSKDIRTYSNCFRPGGELVMRVLPAPPTTITCEVRSSAQRTERL